MFLALKEIQRSPLRFALVAAITTLLCFLVLILSALTLGLARQNTAAFDSWNMSGISLSSDADGQLRASSLTATEVEEIERSTPGRTAMVGYSPVRLEAASEQIQATFIGLNQQEFVAQALRLTSGHLPTNDRAILIDADQEQAAHLQLGQKIGVTDSAEQFTIVGFVRDAKMNVGPVAYGTLDGWRTLRELPPSVVASGVAITGEIPSGVAGVTTWDVDSFRHKIPGYDAQNKTFITLISILALISLTINCVFLYILMLQKLPTIAVLKTQGIPSAVLERSALYQAVSISAVSILVALLVSILLGTVLPSGIPVSFNWALVAALCCGLLGMSAIGAFIPLRQIRNVDPTTLVSA